MSLLLFPTADDARVAADLRHLCHDFALSSEQRTRVLSRFLRTLAQGRSNGVAVMEAVRLIHSDCHHVQPRGAA